MTRARNAEIFRRHQSGDSFGDIASDHGIRRQRVEQIVRSEERRRRREIAELAELERDRRLVAQRRDRRGRFTGAVVGLTTLRVLDEEIQSRRIDRLLGLTGSAVPGPS